MGIFRTRGRIRREAADWVARLGADEDGKNLASFRLWYQADRRHADAYDRIAAIYTAAGRASPSPATRADHVRPVRRPLRFALAASLLAAIVLASILLSGGRWLTEAHGAEEQVLASAIGEIKEIALPDGSRLVLDSNTRIEVRITATERRLTLREGRVRFMVAHERRPFIVSAAANEVVATGTVFDVDLIHGRLAVVLLQGAVEVRRANGRTASAIHRLRAGQKLIATSQSSPIVGRAARGESLWPRRMLEFDEVPLEMAAAMVNRYSVTQLKVGNARIGALRVSGAYRAGDIPGFAHSLAAAFRLRVQPLSNGNLLLAESDLAARPAATSR